MVYTGSLLKIYPVPHDPNNKWVNPQTAIGSFPKEMSGLIPPDDIFPVSRS